MLTALGAVGAFLLVGAVDPTEPGHYPPCPLRALTGWACPGCGTLRAWHALAHGDVPTALDHNVLTVVALPVLVLAWGVWTVRRLRGADPWFARPALVNGFAAVVVAYGVLRNLPFASYLAP